MENRVTEKHIKANGREFILRKFTPFFGVYLATQTFSNIVGSKNKLMDLLNYNKMFFPIVLKYCQRVQLLL